MSLLTKNEAEVLGRGRGIAGSDAHGYAEAGCETPARCQLTIELMLGTRKSNACAADLIVYAGIDGGFHGVVVLCAQAVELIEAAIELRRTLTNRKQLRDTRVASTYVQERMRNGGPSRNERT